METNKQIWKHVSMKDGLEYFIVECVSDLKNHELMVGHRYQVRKGDGDNVIVNGTFYRDCDYDTYMRHDLIHQLNGYHGTTMFGVVLSKEVAKHSFKYLYR